MLFRDIFRKYLTDKRKLEDHQIDETTEMLKKYGVEFKITVNGRKHINTENEISSYLYNIGTYGDVEDFLTDIDLAINDRYDEIEDALLYSDGLLKIYGEITKENLLIYHNDLETVVASVPLTDFKILLLAWKEFYFGDDSPRYPLDHFYK